MRWQGIYEGSLSWVSPESAMEIVHNYSPSQILQTIYSCSMCGYTSSYKKLVTCHQTSQESKCRLGIVHDGVARRNNKYDITASLHLINDIISGKFILYHHLTHQLVVIMAPHLQQKPCSQIIIMPLHPSNLTSQKHIWQSRTAQWQQHNNSINNQCSWYDGLYIHCNGMGDWHCLFTDTANKKHR